MQLWKPANHRSLFDKCETNTVTNKLNSTDNSLFTVSIEQFDKKRT